MNPEALEQLNKVTEAMHTAAISKTLEAKYNLCIEIFKLGEIVPLRQDKLMKIREQFGLTSGIYGLAEYNFYVKKEY